MEVQTHYYYCDWKAVISRAGGEVGRREFCTHLSVSGQAPGGRPWHASCGSELIGMPISQASASSPTFTTAEWQHRQNPNEGTGAGIGCCLRTYATHTSRYPTKNILQTWEDRREQSEQHDAERADELEGGWKGHKEEPHAKWKVRPWCLEFPPRNSLLKPPEPTFYLPLKPSSKLFREDFDLNILFISPNETTACGHGMLMASQPFVFYNPGLSLLLLCYFSPVKLFVPWGRPFFLWIMSNTLMRLCKSKKQQQHNKQGSPPFKCCRCQDGHQEDRNTHYWQCPPWSGQLLLDHLFILLPWDMGESEGVSAFSSPHFLDEKWERRGWCNKWVPTSISIGTCGSIY